MEKCKHEIFFNKNETVTAFFSNGLELGLEFKLYTASCMFINSICEKCGETISSNIDPFFVGIPNPDKRCADIWEANKKYWYSLEFDNSKGENK